jgi:EmrB/QacA subfamily drug resistance transporter
MSDVEAVEALPRIERGGPMLILLAVTAAVVIVTLDTTILNVAIPTIRRELHTDLASLQWVIAGYSLTLGALLVIGGRLGDLFGVRRTFIVGALTFAAGSLVASVATSTPMLVAGEALIEGVGASLLFPASLAALSTRFRGPNRARAFAVWGGAAGAAAALGPLIGGWLASDYSWRWGFRINVIVAPIAALAVFIALPAGDAGTRRPRFDVAGAVLLATGLFMLVFAFTQGPDQGWLAHTGALSMGGATIWPASWPLSPVLPALVASGVALVAFVSVERRKQGLGLDPLFEVRLLETLSFRFGLVTSATVVMAQAGTYFVLAVFLQSTHHLSAIDAGRWLLPAGIAVIVGAQVGGRRATRVGPRTVVRAGIFTLLSGALAAGAVVSPTVAWLPVALCLVVFGLGGGLASSQLTNIILSQIPRARAGSASGAATTNNALGAALGIAIVGSVLRAGVFTDARSAKWALVTTALLLVAGFAASLAIPPLETESFQGKEIRDGRGRAL